MKCYVSDVCGVLVDVCSARSSARFTARCFVFEVILRLFFFKCCVMNLVWNLMGIFLILLRCCVNSVEDMLG